MNEPCVPRKSGTHIALSNAPANFSGGNVSGTRSTFDGIPCSPRMRQNALLLRMLVIVGRPTGINHSPTRIVRDAGRMSELDSRGL